jgi:hypothetical protein
MRHSRLALFVELAPHGLKAARSLTKNPGLAPLSCSVVAGSRKLVPDSRGELMKNGIIRRYGTKVARIFVAILGAVALLGGGYVAGQNRFGQPKTIIHLVELKWNPGVTDEQKRDVMNGLKEMAAKVPGIRNVWLKADRLEPRDFSWAYAIEFRDRDAADAYAESAIHEEWEKRYVPLRYASISVQVTNP